MKARILTAVLLMFALTTFAQTSRRGEQERKSSTREAQNNTNTNSNRTSQKQSTPSREAVKPTNNSRTETNNQTTVNRESRNTSTRENNNNQGNSKTANTREYNNNNRGNSNTGNSREYNNNRGSETRNQGSTQINSRGGSDNRNSGNTRSDQNYGHGNRDNNYKGNPNHGGNTRVVVREGRTYHREYVSIVRPQRKVVVIHNRPGYHHHPVEYRRVHYPYRLPVHRDIIWTVSLYHDFRIFYPEIRVWRYDVGYRLPVIPAYDAELYIGDVARVYGKVQEVFYDYDSDNYFLYVGDYYPYHDFSVVIPGQEARRFTRRPERYFEGSHIAVTGYITDSDNKPEIVVRRASQIDLY